MVRERQYLLDANVFIQAHRLYYAFDLCPGFWCSIKHHGAEGRMASIDRVWDELREGDPLAQWKAEVPKRFLISSDAEDVISAYRDVIAWSQGQERFTSDAKATFAGGVDAWLVACAKARGLIVVTHEGSRPQSKARVLVPDVCKAFKLNYCNTFEMLRSLKIAYRWNQPAAE